MRHEADHADFICPQAGRAGLDDGPITAWTWKPVPEPPLADLGPRGRAWELTRHRDYQAHLAGRPVGEAFERATAFLRRTAAHAAAAAEISSPAG
jgi:hypothetical protein